MKRPYLTKLRKEIGSQALVSSHLGISRTFLGAIENGERNPTVKLMAKMENYFNAPAKELFPDLFFTDICHKTKQNTA